MVVVPRGMKPGAKGGGGMEKSVRERLEAEGFVFEEGTEEALGFCEWFNVKVLGLDPESYRKEFWREVHTTGHTIGHVPRTLDTLLHERCLPRSDDRLAMLFWITVFQGAVFPFWLLIRVLSRKIRQARRGDYYERERERRHRLADERRAVVVRRTTNPRPTLQAIRELYGEIRRTRGRPAGTTPAPAALRLGALLEDLERYVDNHILVKRGLFGCRGRAGGIKRLLQREAPDLFDHYKSIMRYKALAKRYRQACGAADPIPVEALLPAEEGEERRETVDGIDFPRRDHHRDAGDLSVWMHENGNTAYLRTQDWAGNPDQTYSERDVLKPKSLRIAAEILNGCGGSILNLKVAISRLIDPECVLPGARPETGTAAETDSGKVVAAG